VNTMKRRTFLKGAMASSMLAVAAGAGLLRPTEVLASPYPSSAFKTKGVDETLKTLFGTSSHMASSHIAMDVPIQAENAAVVPIKISTKMKADAIAILVPNNPATLAASVDLGSTGEGFFQTRIKMGKTSDVVAVVRSGGKLYTTKQKVKVTVGGCGG
jgi:sulfur-oxidizing protein SoxY